MTATVECAWSWYCDACDYEESCGFEEEAKQLAKEHNEEYHVDQRADKIERGDR